MQHRAELIDGPHLICEKDWCCGEKNQRQMVVFEAAGLEGNGTYLPLVKVWIR